jgi:hypothetical protein
MGHSMNQNRTSQNDRRASVPEPVSRQVEWLAWSLQLAVGFLAGCGVGYQAARLLFLASLDEMLLVATGGGLICGAFTSFYGNRAWMARSIYLAPEPTPHRKGRACSLVVGGVGAAVVMLTLIHHMIIAGRRDHDSPSAGFDAFLLLAALLPGFLVVHALRTGTGVWRFGIIEREETPLIFWVYVLLNSVAALSLLSMML